MPDEQNDMMQVARKRADARIDAAIGDIRKAARKIGEQHGIPENIAGHSIEELLGRMTYVPSMARDLRRACGQEMAKAELNEFMSGKSMADPAPAPPPPKPIEPSKIPDQIPVSMPVDDLSGVTVQTIRALKEHGLATVGDIAGVPDEHLLKVPGIAKKSLQQLRAAISKASGG